MLRQRVLKKESGESGSGFLNKLLKYKETENYYLLANFVGTEQQKDIEKRTPLIEDFFRVKINVKAFSEQEQKGLHAFFHNNEAVFKAMANEFDMPYWAFVALEKKVPLKDLNDTFVYQLKACNLFCPSCYVDDSNKKPDARGKFFSMREIIDVFEQEQRKRPLYNFRPSGGEPTLAIEQWLEALNEIEKRNITAYVQGDTNLTTGHFLKYMEEREITEPHFLEKVAEHPNFGLLCSFKGTDKESFLDATGMPEELSFLEEERWYTFRKFVKAGIDVYPFIYSPNPSSLEKFMKKGSEEFGDGFWLKTWIFPFKLYGPEKARLEKKKIDVEEYQRKINYNFSLAEEIMQELIWKKFHLNYKAIPRAGIKLRAKE